MDAAATKFDVSGGRYSAGAGGRFLLLPPCSLDVSNGRAKLSARYQKPGAGWRALLATVITFIVVAVAAQALGFAAGPGFLIWYWIFSRRLRGDIELDLATAQEAVADDRSLRVAFLIPVEGKPAWVGFGSKDDYAQILSTLRSVPGLNIKSGNVKKSTSLLLVWILAVIFFIAIVAAVSIPSLIEARKRAETKVNRDQLRALSTAINDYQTDTGALPEKLEDLMAEGPFYIRVLPKDPWGRGYVYRRDGESFTLKSLGKDGVESEDDIVFE
jgi:general secretion pathway protein G